MLHLDSKLVNSSMSLPERKEHYIEINAIPCVIYMCDKTLDHFQKIGLN